MRCYSPNVFIISKPFNTQHKISSSKSKRLYKNKILDRGLLTIACTSLPLQNAIYQSLIGPDRNVFTSQSTPVMKYLVTCTPENRLRINQLANPADFPDLAF